MTPVVYYWRKRVIGSFKCNVDAAIFNSDNKYGVGMCVKTYTSEFYCGRSMWFSGLRNRIGLWQAILQLKDMGLPSVSIELDCLPVVNGVHGDTNTEFIFIITTSIYIYNKSNLIKNERKIREIMWKNIIRQREIETAVEGKAAPFSHSFFLVYQNQP